MSPTSCTTSPGVERLPAILGGNPLRPEGAIEWPRSDPAILAALERCFRTGMWGRYDGEATATLRQRLGELHQAEHVILCASGTAAVELALRGLGVGPNDEVVLAAYDFRANSQNVLTVGAKPVLVDIDPATGLIDVAAIANALTDQTRAVIVSHLHGGAVEMSAIRRVCANRSVAIIEDACQMPGAPLGSQIAGMAGDVGVISFGGSKTLSAGRGGAVLTQRADVAARIQRYTSRGNEAYPLSELQATVLLPQLERLAADRGTRAEWVEAFRAQLTQCPGLTLPIAEPASSTPLETGKVELDYYKVALRYDAAQFGGLPREVFAGALTADGIVVGLGFRALHLTHARSRYRAAGPLLHADDADRTWVVIHHPLLLGGAVTRDQFFAAVASIRAHRAAILEAWQAGQITLPPPVGSPALEAFDHV